MTLLSHPCEVQKYEELDSVDSVYKIATPPEWFIQLKYDGIWARVELIGNEYHVYSKTKQLKKRSALPLRPLFEQEPTTLIGEFMFGSQWSTDPQRAGKLFVFDCVRSRGKDISKLPYKDRYRAAVSHVVQLGQPFNILPCYSLSKLGEFWLSLSGEAEGFIIRRWSGDWNDTLFKLKFEVEDDFVITGMVMGEGKHAGRMGALQLSQYENGKLKYIQNVGGGFSDADRDYFHLFPNLGKVALVRGKGRFADGALRHPTFIRLRDDKLPTECLLKRKSK